MAIKPSSRVIVDFLRKIDEHTSFAIFYCSVIPIIIIVIFIVKGDSKVKVVAPCILLKLTLASLSSLMVTLKADFLN